jgi:hypothetical protein
MQGMYTYWMYEIIGYVMDQNPSTCLCPSLLVINPCLSSSPNGNSTYSRLSKGYCSLYVYIIHAQSVGTVKTCLPLSGVNLLDSRWELVVNMRIVQGSRTYLSCFSNHQCCIDVTNVTSLLMWSQIMFFTVCGLSGQYTSRVRSILQFRIGKVIQDDIQFRWQLSWKSGYEEARKQPTVSSSFAGKCIDLPPTQRMLGERLSELLFWPVVMWVC